MIFVWVLSAGSKYEPRAIAGVYQDREQAAEMAVQMPVYNPNNTPDVKWEKIKDGDGIIIWENIAWGEVVVVERINFYPSSLAARSL